jgi:hypothetical protein
MSEVEELESRIRNLTPESLAQLRDWFYQFDEELWDRQIEADYRAGKFDKLIEQARTDIAQGKVRDL